MTHKLSTPQNRSLTVRTVGPADASELHKFQISSLSNTPTLTLQGMSVLKYSRTTNLHSLLSGRVETARS